jgi:hypothetical protein
VADEILVFNHHQANLNVRTSTNPAGVSRTRSYISTTVHSEPIVAMLDEGAVAKRAAEMLAKRIREQTEAIVDTVKASTAKARRTVEKAFYSAKPWAWRRFDGGRTGVTPPRQGENRMFNHSGRLARSIVAGFVKSTKEWRINYTNNRWKLSDFRSAADMAAAFQKWVARVPVLQDASSDLGIQRAIRETARDLLHKQRMDASHREAVLKGQAIRDVAQKASGVLSDTSMTEDEEAAS